jgi:L-lactate permease
VKERPGFLWTLFYGRRRRGFPGLLVAVLATVFIFALVFAIPGGADASRVVAAVAFGLLVLGALVFAVIAVWRPRR